MMIRCWLGFVVAACLATTLFGKEKPFDPAKEPPRKVVAVAPLELKAREELLGKRLGVGILSTGASFNSYASFLFSGPGLVVHTDVPEVGATRLRNGFPPGYRPTVAELFDHLGRQTNASWTYDEKRGYWLFNQPAAPLPFRVTLAEGWKSEARSDYLFGQPPNAPVGMDIYVIHTFSVEPAELAAFQRKSCESASAKFARDFKRDFTSADLTAVKLGSHEAWVFQCPTPRPGTNWRQWAIAENGIQIVVVSAMEQANETELLPQVEAMIASLQIGVPAPEPVTSSATH